VEVPPGKHLVTVRGASGNVFSPAEYTINLAAEETTTVVFVSQCAAQAQIQRQAAVAAAAAAAAANPDGASSPPSVDPSTLTPAQRQRYLKLQQAMDSIRRAKKPQP
jgi:hypothetical protein